MAGTALIGSTGGAGAVVIPALEGELALATACLTSGAIAMATSAAGNSYSGGSGKVESSKSIKVVDEKYADIISKKLDMMDQ